MEEYFKTFKNQGRDFPGGPVVINLLSNAGDMGLIPSQGTKISYAVGQFSPHTSTMDPMWSGACVSQLEKPVHLNKKFHMLQLKPRNKWKKFKEIIE